MTRSALFVLGAVALACEGREVSVFELPALTGGAGQGGSAAVNEQPSSGAGGAASGAPAAAGGGVGAQGGGGSAPDAGAPPMTYGGTAPVVPTAVPCLSNLDCQPGWVCDKRSCDEGATGECVPRSLLCDPLPKPVCGCDGITYWNDCVRLQFESPTPLAGPDQCRASACTCEVGADCNMPYASCSHLLPPGAMCGHGEGACWVLPPQCDPNADPKRWRECKPPPDGVAPKCVDTCTAIATEHSYAELHRGEVCN